MLARTPIPVFIAPPTPVRAETWRAQVKNQAFLRYQELLALAGIPGRVSGPVLQRRIYFDDSGSSLKPVGGCPDVLVSLAAPQTPGQARKVLGILAYGFLDYAAREAVCGRGYFRAASRPGRPRTGKAASGKERTRKARARQAARQGGRGAGEPLSLE